MRSGVNPLIYRALLPLALASLLTACVSSETPPESEMPTTEQAQANARAETVEDDRLKVKDSQGHSLTAKDLQTASNCDVEVTLDGKALSGQSAECEQNSLHEQLGEMFKSRLNGRFIQLPLDGGVNLGSYSAMALARTPNKIFICGGDESPNHVRFSPTKTWLVERGSKKIQPGPEMHWPRKEPTLTDLDKGRILICGGHSGDDNLTITAELEIFDPTTGLISSAGKMTRARDKPALAVLDNGKVLIVGGEQPVDYESTVVPATVAQPVTAELYDPETQKSRTLGPLFAPPHVCWVAPVGQSSALVAGYRHLVFSGNGMVGQSVIIDTALPP